MEFIIVFVVILIVLFIAFRYGSNSRVGPLETYKPHSAKLSTQTDAATGRVKFSDIRHERHYDKETGSIVLEKDGLV